jgi:hypothetical protein
VHYAYHLSFSLLSRTLSDRTSQAIALGFKPGSSREKPTQACGIHARALEGFTMNTNNISHSFPATDFGPLFQASDEESACVKCHGRGNFIGYTGRVVGKCFACDGSGLSAAAPKSGAAIDVSAISTAFTAAHENGIKTPKLRLSDFIFSRAPDHGRNSGAIYVKNKISGEYLGKVSKNQFHPVSACDDTTRDRIIEAAANPAESAKAYGMRTGTCSCCGRELTNGLSIDLGIGPICRDKYGW